MTNKPKLTLLRRLIATVVSEESLSSQSGSERNVRSRIILGRQTRRTGIRAKQPADTLTSLLDGQGKKEAASPIDLNCVGGLFSEDMSPPRS